MDVIKSTVKSTVLWNLTPCSLLQVYRNFGSNYCLHLQDERMCQASIRILAYRNNIIYKVTSLATLSLRSYKDYYHLWHDTMQSSTSYQCFEGTCYMSVQSRRFFYSEDRDSGVFRSIVNSIPDYTVSHPRTLTFIHKALRTSNPTCSCTCCISWNLPEKNKIPVRNGK
jgi:hypothetical protein